MLRSVVVTAWLVAACGFKINQMGSDLRTVMVRFWVSMWSWQLKKRGFGDVGFDILRVVVFVPLILLWPMFSVNFLGLYSLGFENFRCLEFS